jgi:tetratricopeptide (TPR) repeat protein
MMASVLTLAVLAVLGSLGWLAWNRALQKEQAERDLAARRLVVTEFLKESDRHLQANNWQQSLAEARRAEAALASGSVNEDVKDRVAQRLKDLQMVGDLEELAAGASWDPDRKQVITYATLFRQYGIDVDTLPAEDVAAQIRTRGIRHFLVGALDFWSMEGTQYWAVPTRTRPERKRLKRQLLAITRVADPDEFRNRIRDALAENDSATLLKLADAARTTEFSPAAVTLLAKALFSVGEREKAVFILRGVQPKYPDDLEITSALASYLWKNPKTRPDCIRYYQAAVALRPRSLGLAVNLGVALQNAGRHDEALVLLQRTAELYPRNAYAQYNLGTSLIYAGRFPEAVSALKETIRLKSDLAPAHTNLGVAYGKQRKWGPAITALKEGLRLAPDDPNGLMNLGIDLAETGQFDEALAACRKAVEIQPSFAMGHTNLGGVFQRMGRIDEAIPCFRKALELDPTLVAAHFNLGLALQRKGKLTEAVACYRKALDLEPKNTAARINLGIALAGQGKTREAIACYRKVIELDPKHAAALNGLAWQLAACADPRFRNLAEAVQCAEASTRLAPDDRDSWNTLALAYYRDERYQDANAALEKSMALRKGGDASDWFLRAMLRQQSGQTREAQTWYDKAVGWMERNPSGVNADLRRLQVEARELLTTLNEELVRARKAVELAPQSADAHFKLGLALDRQDRYTEALAAYRQALAINPKGPGAYYNMGRLLRLKGAIAEAINANRQALRLKPNHAGARLALAGLLGVQGRELERKQAWPQAIAAYREALTLKTVNDPGVQYRLAHVLATSCPDPRYRDGAEAVKLAELALAADRNDGANWSTLGIARYRGGQWAASIEALHKARQLQGDRVDGVAYFILAMAHWQKDERQEARRWYDTGVRWVDEHQKSLKQHPEPARYITRTRAEAEELLGIKKKEP